MPAPKKVFISYSHDSTQHRELVRQLSDHLRTDGLDCQIDQYVNGFPPEGWQRWMENQLDTADYVLLVCTETYLRRYRGQETTGGKGVNFEGLVISQHLYDAYYQNTKFIPVIMETGSFEHVPIPLRGFNTYTLNRDYDLLYRYLTQQPEHVAPPLGQIKLMSSSATNTILSSNKNTERPQLIHSDCLPTVKGEFFGRELELNMLNVAWTSNATRVVQFIAAGGTGKTKLLRHWLDQTKDIDVLLAWSFYSQGSSEDKQTSASPFFIHLFEKLGTNRTSFSSEEAKGEYLADLLKDKRYVLVLDGLEPLQQAGNGMRGELKDRALRQLLKSLLKHSQGLCIITTRIVVYELQNRSYVISQKLDNLATNDGVKLLKSLHVHGSDVELAQAVQEYNCHALALHLLGNALRTYLNGDVRKRDTLDELIDEYDADSRHAAKVMQAYRYWLTDTPELKLLQILGLFDHPVDLKVLEVLWDAQILGLTKDIPDKAWKVAIRDLREQHYLLSEHQGKAEVFDCHPLIREYFGRQLSRQWPEIWQQAHTVLYDYYKTLPEKEFPDTLEEMQPLFKAVAHGCAAQLTHHVFYNTYWLRIHRKEVHYSLYQLGAFNEDLTALAHFFEKHWSTITPKLDLFSQLNILNWAGFCLRALGRFQEAIEVTKINFEITRQSENWTEAANALSNLCEIEFHSGNITEAQAAVKIAIDYSDKSNKAFLQMSKRALYAYVLYLNGKISEASRMFKESEDLQGKYEPHRLQLHSLRNFYYSQLLLSQGTIKDVIERTNYSLIISTEEKGRLSIALDKLALGFAYLQANNFTSAKTWINQSVSELYSSSRLDYLPFGLLIRAKLYHSTQCFSLAHQDLQEVYEIAELCGMRLHLTDYHLEMARLLIAEQKFNEAKDHTIAAAKLIEDTGYHRRDGELVTLKQQLAFD